MPDIFPTLQFQTIYKKSCQIKTCKAWSGIFASPTVFVRFIPFWLSHVSIIDLRYRKFENKYEIKRYLQNCFDLKTLKAVMTCYDVEERSYILMGNLLVINNILFLINKTLKYISLLFKQPKNIEQITKFTAKQTPKDGSVVKVLFSLFIA